MRKYYTRPCNFYYGDYAKKLIKNKKALILAGNPNIAFDQVEIFHRKKGFTQSTLYSISKLDFLNKEKKSISKSDLKKITAKRKNLTGIKLYNGTDTTNFGLSGRVTTYGLKYS